MGRGEDGPLDRPLSALGRGLQSLVAPGSAPGGEEAALEGGCWARGLCLGAERADGGPQGSWPSLDLPKLGVRGEAGICFGFIPCSWLEHAHPPRGHETATR